jgi:tight adherence protein B
MSSVILVATALTCLAIAEAIYYTIRYSGERRRNELKRRLRAVGEQASANLLREGRVARNPELERVLRLFPFTEPLEQLILQTDLSWTVASMLGLGLLSAIVTAGAFGALFGTKSSLLVLGSCVGFTAPFLFLLWSRSQRSSALSSQLPEALDMMVRSLRAGHGLSAAIKLVATEMPVPVAVEFERCFEESSLGVDFREAVGNMTRRVPNNLDLKIFAVSVVLQHETGGNLVEVLDQIGHTIRERYKFYGKLAALTAEGKISGLILGILPFATAAFVSIGNPEYLRVLIDKPIGHYFIAAAFLLWSVGAMWLMRLTKVDY